jgi:RNA polymerase sigma factor (sigma-70 family)
MSIPDKPMENVQRGRIIGLTYHAMVAAVHKLRKRYHTPFEDAELTVDDLTQHGVVKAIEYYDRLADDSSPILQLPEADLKKVMVGFAMRCIACHVIDAYRKRDRRSALLVTFAELTPEIDDTDVRRVELWRRLEDILPRISPRQRDVVVNLWHGQDLADIGSTLRVTANVVQKDLAAIRRVAA